MIRLFFRLPIFLVLVLAIVWTAVLGIAKSPEGLVEGNLERLAQAYPNMVEREAFISEWGVLPSSALGQLSRIGGSASAFGRAGLLVTLLHLGGLVRLLPVFVLLVISGVASGLVFRERMRDAEGYASPTAAGLARTLVGLGIFLLGLFAGSPIPASYGWLYPAGIASGLGASLYAANLPLKL